MNGSLNAWYDEFLPNCNRADAVTEVARVGFERCEDVEIIPGADESAAGAPNAAFVERVSDGRYGDAAAH